MMRFKQRKALTDLVHDTELSPALSLHGWSPVAVVLSSVSFLLVGTMERLCPENKRSKVQKKQ